MKKKLLLSSLLMIIGVSNSYAADGYIYKYKDKSGKIIYADRLPASEKGEVVILSSKSGTIKKIVEKEMTEQEIQKRDDNKVQQKIVIEQSELQKKKDYSLLSTYSNADEIDKMKKYELDQIDQGIKNNIDNIAILKDKLAILETNKKTSPNNKNIQNEYDKTATNLNSLQQTMDSNKTMYAQREKKYDEDKSRYLNILKEMSNEKKQEINN